MTNNWSALGPLAAVPPEVPTPAVIGQNTLDQTVRRAAQNDRARGGTLGTLGMSSAEDGPQFADGSRWHPQAVGTTAVNGGTVVMGAGCLWVRESPRWTAEEFSGNLQSLHDAAPHGARLDVTRGGVMDVPVVFDGTRHIIGGGISAPLMPTAAAGGHPFTIRPPADGNTRDGMRVQDLAILADDPNSGDALYVDLTGNRRLARMKFDNLFLRAGSGYAMLVYNEPSHADGFFASEWTGGVFQGGLRIIGGGDSLSIRGGTFTGQNESIYVNLITQASAGAGDSTRLLIDGVNCTGDKGVVINTGSRFTLSNSNIEGGAGPGTDNALISLQGTGAERIVNGAIVNNYIAAAPHIKYGIHVGVCDGIRIEGNTIASPGAIAGSACIHVSGDAKNTFIGLNTWEGPENVIDNGVGTMGIAKPLANVTPTAGRSYPQFLKQPTADAARVSWAGSASTPNTAGAQIAYVAYGFRPVTNMVFVLPCRNAEFVWSTVRATLYTSGELTIDQVVTGLGESLAEVALDAVAYACALVP